MALSASNLTIFKQGREGGGGGHAEWASPKLKKQQHDIQQLTLLNSGSQILFFFKQKWFKISCIKKTKQNKKYIWQINRSKTSFISLAGVVKPAMKREFLWRQQLTV